MMQVLQFNASKLGNYISDDYYKLHKASRFDQLGPRGGWNPSWSELHTATFNTGSGHLANQRSVRVGDA